MTHPGDAMRYDELPTTAQAFLRDFMDTTWRNRVKDNAHNQALIDAYLAYKEVQQQVATAYQGMDVTHADYNTVGANILAAMTLSTQGNFEGARDAMLAELQRIVRADADVNKANRAADLRAAAAAIGVPAGTTGTETTALTAACAAVGNAMALPVPTANEIALALDLLTRLRAQTELTKRVIGAAALATTACARLPDGDDVDEMRAELGPINTARGTVPGNDSITALADLTRRANAHFDTLLKAEQAPITAARTDWMDALQALTTAEKLDADVADRDTQIAAAQQKVDEARAAFRAMEPPADGAMARRCADMLASAQAAGPLAPGARRTISPDFVGLVPQFQAAFDRNPELAAQALEVACDVPDPTALANGIAALCDRVNEGFLIQGGARKGMVLPGNAPMMYGKAAMEVGAHYGGTYFDDLIAYTTSGRMAGPGFGAPNEGETPGHLRSRSFADALLGEDGAIVLTPEALKPLRDDLRFHPSSLFRMNDQPPSRETGLHIERTLTQLADPDSTVAADISATLQAVEAPAPGSAGATLIRNSLGLGADDPIDKATTQKAILTTLMSPVYQGKVGSCFSTAPVIGLREQDPAAFVEKIAEIVQKGTLTVKDSDPPITVPAVTKVPPDDTGDPLLRSLEYSVAAAGAVMEGSRQREKLGEAGKLAVTNILNGLMPGGQHADHSAVLDPIADEIAEEMNKLVTFDYVPDADVLDQVGGGDGRSTQGRFVLQEIGDDGLTEINDVGSYIALFKKVAGSIVTEDKIDPKIVAEFDEAVDEYLGEILGAHRRKPWDIEPGDTSDGPLQVLYGGDASAPSITDGLPPAPDRGARSAQVLGCVVGAVGDAGGKRETFGIAGKHAFTVLTDTEMFKTINTGDADDLGDRIEEHLIDPGKVIAATPVPVARAAKLFEQRVKASIDPTSADPKRKQLFDEAIRLAPRADITPSDLSDLIDTAIEPLLQLRATQLENGGDTLPDVPDASGAVQDRADAMKSGVQNATKAALIKDLAPPEIVLADANWGGEDGHDFFVMTTDPVSGAFDLWIRTEPSGKMSPVRAEYIEGDWRHCKP